MPPKDSIKTSSREWQQRGKCEKNWGIVHSATASCWIPLEISFTSLLLPCMFRGPKPGCLTPSAAPNILLPGSPILGPPLSACKIAGSSGVGDTAEFMSSLSVGCDGRLGRVGDGSRFSFACGCSGMEPFMRKLLLPPLPLLLALREGKTEMDAARLLWPREGLLMCWPRELTVCIMIWASGPS